MTNGRTLRNKTAEKDECKEKPQNKAPAPMQSKTVLSNGQKSLTVYVAARQVLQSFTIVTGPLEKSDWG